MKESQGSTPADADAVENTAGIIVFMIDSSSWIKSDLILDLLHNLHVIRNDLQSDKTRPAETRTQMEPSA